MWTDLLEFVVAVGCRADLRLDCDRKAADIRLFQVRFTIPAKEGVEDPIGGNSR
jgi:hypothetical protein